MGGTDNTQNQPGTPWWDVAHFVGAIGCLTLGAIDALVFHHTGFTSAGDTALVAMGVTALGIKAVLP